LVRTALPTLNIRSIGTLLGKGVLYFKKTFFIIGMTP